MLWFLNGDEGVARSCCISTVAILAQGTISWLATRSPFWRPAERCSEWLRSSVVSLLGAAIKCNWAKIKCSGGSGAGHWRGAYRISVFSCKAASGKIAVSAGVK